MSAPLLVIAAGGTGGHMFPAQSLAEVMLARGWRVKLSTDARGKRYAGGFPEAVQVVETFSATTARGKLLDRLAVPFVILAGVVWETMGMLRERPAVVVGFGGYPSIPALLAAWILRRPRMIHEQNGVLGRVNRVLARRVQKVACGTWPTALPSGVTGIHTGNPVRASVKKRAGAPFIPPGDYPMAVLVFGGSQGARVISQKIPEVLAALPQKLRRLIRVSHQAREEDTQAVAAAYAAAGISAEIKPFFDDIPTRIAEAQMVICRSGASSVADLTVIGRPAVLVPFAAAAADHQTANARPLAEAGAAYVVPEAALDVGLAVQVEELLTDPDLAGRMAANALSLGRPDAAEALAALVEELSGRQTT